jgi:Zinc finger, C3HC4 type (RING finger)
MNVLGDKSLDLFDINEHDLEYEGEHQTTQENFDESFSLDLQNHTANIFGYQHHQEPQFRSNPFADPFHIFDSNNGNNHVLSSIAESVEHHFHTLQHPANLRYSPASNFFPPGEALFHQTAPPVFPEPTYAPIPQTLMPVPVHAPLMGGIPRPSFNPVYTPVPVVHHESLAPPKVELTEPPTDCSVCLASYPPSLAVLQPCRHPLCSGCLTSALNIVGEKDMECAVCKTAVADFKLVTIKKPAGKASSAGVGSEKHNAPTPLQDSPMIGVESKELEGAFEFGFDDFASGIRASTPKMEQQAQGGRNALEVSTSSSRSNKSTGKVILRIDNVPWVCRLFLV